MGQPFPNPVAGGNGALLIEQIKSPNFDQVTMTGWAILQDGSAFFFDITINGNVVVDGNGGVFVYTGTPGPGNPPIAWISNATADPDGNPIVPGIGTEATGAFPRQMVMQLGGLEGSPGGVLAGQFALLQPFEAPTGLPAWSTSDLYSDVWRYVGTAGNAAFAADWGNFGHGGAQLAYRKVPSPANEVRLNGVVTPSAGAGTTLFTLPAAYVPASVQFITASNVTTGGAVYWSVNPGGAVVLGGGGLVAGDEYTVNGLFSRDI